MPRSFLRRRSGAGVVLLAIGATTLFGGAGPAHATHGPSGLVTGSDGGTVIRAADDSVVTSYDGYDISDAAWSPDGSRAVFVTDLGDIATIGANTEFVYPIVEATDGVTRATPEWVGDGSTVVWAAKSSGTPWRIEESVAAYGYDAVRRSPNDGNHYSEPDTNGSSRLVVQKQASDASGNPTGTPEIGFLDGSTYTRIVTDAASPSVSADGSKVAFIRGGQVWVTATSAGATPIQVTTGGSAKSDPVLKADGTSVAFNQGSSVGAAATTAGAAVSVVPHVLGVPDFQPTKKDRVVRLAGTDRFGTANAISQSHWASRSNASDPRPKASVAVLSRSDTFADALGGSALATAKTGPLLMTPTTTLQPSVGTELTRILNPGSTVYLLGSAAGALSTTVENQVRALGFTPKRVAGTDRFATSIAIANEIDPTPGKVLAATGMNFPDALAAGAAAGAQNLPGKGSSAVVVLTNDDKLPPATKSYLDTVSSSAEIYGIGLWGDIATRSYGGKPLAGASRYETAMYIAYEFFGGSNHLGVATGANWPDALAGGALMGSLDAPLMLTPGTSEDLLFELAIVADEMSGSVHTGLVFGSAPVVNATQLDILGYFISGPSGYTAVNNATNVYRATETAVEVDARRAAADSTADHSQRDAATIKAAAEAVQKAHAER
ncbi:cell wall-binding repeat-containing protein [Micromonospora sp. NPDC126480]|uniref:cell wall-binding repeat-containing protein n=1 Tax=Micromonospora sp. NPDC126480 TaxID=3155312 RepID=UPI003323D22C